MNLQKIITSLAYLQGYIFRKIKNNIPAAQKFDRSL